MAKSSPSCVRYLKQHRADRVAAMYNMADLADALARAWRSLITQGVGLKMTQDVLAKSGRSLITQRALTNSWRSLITQYPLPSRSLITQDPLPSRNLITQDARAKAWRSLITQNALAKAAWRQLRLLLSCKTSQRVTTLTVWRRWRAVALLNLTVQRPIVENHNWYSKQACATGGEHRSLY